MSDNKKVNQDMIDILSEVLETVSGQLNEESAPEDFESKSDLLESTINNIRADFADYKL